MTEGEQITSPIYAEANPKAKNSPATPAITAQNNSNEKINNVIEINSKWNKLSLISLALFLLWLLFVLTIIIAFFLIPYLDSLLLILYLPFMFAAIFVILYPPILFICGFVSFFSILRAKEKGLWLSLIEIALGCLLTILILIFLSSLAHGWET